MSRGAFLKVKCGECGNEQVVFEKPAEDVECIVCDNVIAASRGGKAAFQSKILSAVQQ